jgi:hypothetical protein
VRTRSAFTATDGAYRLSFTTGGLLRAEAAAVAELFLNTNDVTAARAAASEQNLMQQRTTASTTRVTREVLQRLSELPRAGVELVAHGPVADAAQVMWLAACMRYRFLRDFGREVIRDRYVSGRTLLTYQDFDAFWNLQSSWVDELRDAADSTRKKLRQNTFRMVLEAGFLEQRCEIRAVVLSPAVTEVVLACAPKLLLSFPVDDMQVSMLATSEGAQ